MHFAVYLRCEERVRSSKYDDVAGKSSKFEVRGSKYDNVAGKSSKFEVRSMTTSRGKGAHLPCRQGGQRTQKRSLKNY
jgi:hypothetical protein